jgi:hypothetical protein
MEGRIEVMKKKEMLQRIEALEARVAALEAIVNLFPRVVPQPVKQPDRVYPPYVSREPGPPLRFAPGYFAVNPDTAHFFYESKPLTESEMGEMKKLAKEFEKHAIESLGNAMRGI